MACSSARSGLQTRSEHLDGTDKRCCCGSGNGACNERSVGVGKPPLDQAPVIGPQPVVSSEVDDVPWNAHHQSRTESTPEGQHTLISRDLPQSIQGRCECFALRFFHGAIRDRCSPESPGLRSEHTYLSILSNPKDFPTTSCYSKIGGSVLESLRGV